MFGIATNVRSCSTTMRYYEIAIYYYTPQRLPHLILILISKSTGIPYHGPSKIRRGRDGLRKRRRIDFTKLNDPGCMHSGNHGGHHQHLQLGMAGTNGIQDVDFWTMICQRKKNRVNFFNCCSSGQNDVGVGGGSCSCLLDLPVGEEFNAAFVSRSGFDRPILFTNKTPSQLGLRVPLSEDIAFDNDCSSFGYANVATLVGPYRIVQVIDTATQLTTECTLQEWVEYLETPPKERIRTLNIITLEFSQTPLGELVTEPQFARDVGFVNLHWPQSVGDVGSAPTMDEDGTNGIEEKSTPLSQSAEELGDLLETLKKEQPRVSKYCLMSAAGSFTDFHVDFGGTSVWYHVYFGSKIFYFIEPTSDNLKIYSDWATNSSGKNGNSRYVFLPDLIVSAGGEVYEVTLQKGQTLFIASGWIHAVYTPEDSLVFGGNFLHRHSLEMQFTIYKLERKMKVGAEFRFPNYQKLMWYVARDFLLECTKLTSHKGQNANASIDDDARDLHYTQIICQAYSPRVLRGYHALSKELMRWSTSKAKQIVEQFPENINVVTVSEELGRIMKLCAAYLDPK